MAGFLFASAGHRRPPFVPLAIEWPHDLVATMSESRQVSFGGKSCTLLDTEFRVTSHDTTGPLGFELVTPHGALGFEYEFRPEEPPLIRPTGGDGTIETAKGQATLSAFLTQVGLFVTFEDEIVLMEQGFLLRPDREQRLFPKEAIETFDWSDINIRRESQGADRDPTSIQYRTVQALAAEAEWEIALDDDGTGELADVVMLRRDGDLLHIVFAHCKYSSEFEPGARIADLYEVCGQAMKMNRAKSMPELLARRLLRRETKRQSLGRSGLLEGTVELLTEIVRESKFRRLDAIVVIVQPGLSRSRVSDDMRALLGGTDRFLEDLTESDFRVVGREIRTLDQWIKSPLLYR